ncbi:MAG: HD domain-containing protein [Peptostreptococcaceae bacterium]
MNKDLIIENTKIFVRKKLQNEGSGHDYFHIERVYNMSKEISKYEECDLFIVELTALLHDIDDWKFNDKNKNKTKNIRRFLISEGLSESYIKKIENIIKTISFKGGIVDSTQNSIEGMIVQDADRLDALGAIGISRAFIYGGSKGNIIYDPSIEPKKFKSLDEVKGKNTVINHFYKKSLKLKDLMNTKKGKEIAMKRHKFMEKFLDEIYSEINI